MGRREENKRHKRAALAREGLRAFREQGYDAASIEQIALSAGVARGTFYLYFPDKLALFEALMDEWFVPVTGVLEDVEAEIRSATTSARALEVYRGMALGLAVIGVAHALEVEVAFRASRQPGEAGAAIRRRELTILERVDRFTEDAARRGLIRVSNPRLFARVVFGAVERLFYEALLGTDLGDARASAEEVLGWFAAALGIGPGE